MFTFEWIKEMDTQLPTMIAVSGIYQYFDKDKIIDMIKRLDGRKLVCLMKFLNDLHKQ